jgi:hypothetical protein
VWPEPWYPTPPTIWTTTVGVIGTTSGSYTNTDTVSQLADNSTPTITCSSAKWGASGSYDVDGRIVNFR